MKKLLGALLLVVLCLLGLIPTSAHALPLGVTQGAFGNLGLLFTDPVAKPFVKVIGLGYDHRPYEPATPLGTNAGMDISIEATLAHVPADFVTAMSTLGQDVSALPILPVAKVHLAKGFGPVDVGLSGIWYSGYYSIGGDVKVNLYDPEEGITWAARLGYNQAIFGTTFGMKASSWTPAILISRRLSFANPYMGMAYHIISGSVFVNYPVDTPAGTITYSDSYATSVSCFEAFLGVGFWLGPSGIKITVEGAASGSDMATMGTKIGFNF